MPLKKLTGTAIIGIISALTAILICRANSVVAADAPPTVRDGRPGISLYCGWPLACGAASLFHVSRI
jgi:hypothetical protein